MAMPTESAVLTLAQWLSPAYPVGAFSYSHGLEWAVAAGQVCDADGLKDWLCTVLDHGSGRSDALFLAAAFHAAGEEDLARIDATCRAYAPARERLMESDLQGAAFCEVTGKVWGKALARLAYPVAIGRAARLEDLPLEVTSTLYLQAFAANLVAAGQRLFALGQSEAQALVRTLSPLCSEVAQATAEGDLDALSGTAFLADIAAMKHETQYSRIFRT